MNNKLVINVNRTTKTFRYVGMPSYKEIIDLEINNISDVNPSNLVLSLFTKTKVQAIIATGFSLSGDVVVGNLILRSDVLETVFSTVRSSSSKVFGALLWDSVSDTIIFNGYLNIKNNPYDETLEPAPVIDVKRYMVQYSMDGETWSDDVLSGTRFIRMSVDSGETYGSAIELSDGASAYDVWLRNGNAGTEQDFLDSLVIIGQGITQEQSIAIGNSISHAEDSNIHITIQERESWNGKSTFSGSYNDLLEKPIIPSGVFITSYNQLEDQLDLSGYALKTEIPVVPSGFSGSYTDLVDKPTLFSGSYIDLTDKPTLPSNYFSGDYEDLINKPLFPSGIFITSYNELEDKPDLSQYALKTEIPILPSGLSVSYNDLTDKPIIPSGFSGDYTDLINKPDLSIYARNEDIQIIPSGISSFLNDVGYITVVSYEDIVNKPVLFSGNYSDLIDAPSLPSSYFSGEYSDLANLPSLFSGNYLDLLNIPNLFSGNYNDLINIPTLFSGNYNDLSNTPILPSGYFEGNYNDLTNKPDLSEYSLVSHNHAGVYSVMGHTHDGVYSTITHDHDGRYPIITDGVISIDVIPNTKITWEEVSTSELTMVDNHGYRANTTNNAVLLNMPQNPNIRDRVAIKALNLSHELYIYGNGKNIEGESQIINIDSLDTFILVYAGGTIGWIITLDLGVEDLNFIIDESQGAFSYLDLTNKPDLSIFALQSSLDNISKNLSSYTNDIGFITTISYNDIMNKPTLFSGNYNDLTNKPIVSSFSGNYADLTNKPTLFSGNYNDLTNKPSLNTGITNPMTAVGDIIYGGANGEPARLAKGIEGQSLKMINSVPTWLYDYPVNTMNVSGNQTVLAGKRNIISPTSNLTLAPGSFQAGQGGMLITHSAGNYISWSNSFKWVGKTLPVLVDSGIDVISLYSPDGSIVIANWIIGVEEDSPLGVLICTVSGAGTTAINGRYYQLNGIIKHETSGYYIKTMMDYPSTDSYVISNDSNIYTPGTVYYFWSMDDGFDNPSVMTIGSGVNPAPSVTT
ncbi:MAG: hypothetical protein M0P71_01180 [Melioribacteraceae bacterium]|nr:hypothetical protein [Melioribacteraceae bacterium]